MMTAGLSASNLDSLFERLAKSGFRSRFKLGPTERTYLADKGMDVVVRHARDFVDARLAPAAPPNDGKQTPMRGHPVFVGQHATATCCRACLSKWHGISAGRELDEEERRYVVAVIERWLVVQSDVTAVPRKESPGRKEPTKSNQPDLFDPEGS
jgi:hypothetical protein